MIIANQRKRLGLTQKQLSAELGITVRQVSRLENLETETSKTIELAIECLLRRAGLYGEEQQHLHFY